MDLKKFITQSMVEIMTGVKEAQDQLAQVGSHARIAPDVDKSMAGQESLIGRSKSGRAVSVVEYDIAVEVSSDGADGVIKVLGVFAVKGQMIDASKIASRIKFTVPVCYPEIVT